MTLCTTRPLLFSACIIPYFTNLVNAKSKRKRLIPLETGAFIWLRRQDLNLRPSGYGPDELPSALLRDILVSVTRVELVRYCYQRVLSPLRLPISPHRHLSFFLMMVLIYHISFMVSTFFALCSDKRQQSLTAYVPMPKGMGLTPHLINKQQKRRHPERGAASLLRLTHDSYFMVN